jgi:hypothetical protein
MYWAKDSSEYPAVYSNGGYDICYIRGVVANSLAKV